MSSFKHLDEIDVSGKKVICRVDLNVPMVGGKVEDLTRISRLVPTFEYLIKHNAKVIIISHFGRPKGKFNMEMTLAPIADALSGVMQGREVKFAVDCVGSDARKSVDKLQNGEMLLLENLRFHDGETNNDEEFTNDLASLGDIYVNDTFSCSHRSHASIVGLPKKLPSVAGHLLADEVENLEKLLNTPKQPIASIVGGAKISSKINLLNHLVDKSDILIIGGGMANTFIKAQGYEVGKSLYEPNLIDTAKDILRKANDNNCEIILPIDVVVAQKFEAKSECKVCMIDNVASDGMILDIGFRSVANLSEKLEKAKTIIWNGPMGAFELSPFDVGSISLAQIIATLTDDGKILSVAGGGDVVSAINCSGLTKSFSYISTAGGAFLQWLEGKPLVGIEALNN